MHLLLVGISHRTAPVELRERRRLPGARPRGGAAGARRARIDARSGRALDLQPRRALRRVRRRRRRRAPTCVRFVSEFHGVDRADAARRTSTTSSISTPRGICSASPPASTRWSSASRRSSARSRTRTPLASERADRRARAQPAVPLVVRRRQARAHRNRPRRRAPSRSASPRSRWRARSSATSTGRSVLVIGAGEMGKLTALHMKSQGVQQRDDRQPHDGARGADGRSHRRRAARRRGTSWTPSLGASDIVITATGAATPILTQGAHRGGDAAAPQPAALHHRHRVPRDVEAGGRRDRAGVPLQHRRSAGDRAREPGAARQRGRRAPRRSSPRRSSKFAAWLRSRGAIPTVVALRQRFENDPARRARAARLQARRRCRPKRARRVDEITRLIVEKLLLTPTEQLKALGDPDTVGAYSEALTRLFGLATDGEHERRRRTSRPTRPKPRDASKPSARDRSRRRVGR